jgi:hypothetical protein
MANFEYKNINEIIADNNPKRGITFPLEDLALLEKRTIVPEFDPSVIDSVTGKNSFNVELHVFLRNLFYVKSAYNIDTYSLVDGKDYPSLSLQIHRDLENLSVPPTEYKVVYNFLRDFIGSYDSKDKMFISEISDDRTELKLSLANPNSEQGVAQLARFVLENLKPKTFIPPIVLNFGENKLVDVINVTSDGDPFSFYVKLYEPLSPDLDIFFTCWVAVRLMKPYIDTVNILPDQFEPEIPFIKGPNFEVDYDYWTTSDTEYKSWTEILSENVQTSEQLINRYISGSSLPVTLNVDYTDFKNFVYYSNARDRVDNFAYKMELIEFYKSELNTLSTITGSVATNRIKIQLLKDKVISGFDGFEKYLYYNSTGSYNYTYQISASIVPYPKYELDVTASVYDIATKEGKFNFYSYTSSFVENWLDSLLEYATDYDAKNYTALAKALPDHIREDSDNDQAVTFVNMLGQHFDIMYLYTDHILKKNLRMEHPNDGISQDLIFDATRNLGWTLSHGTQTKDLWEYALGISGSTEPIWTGKTTINKYLAKSYEERTKEVWRRIFNNLPYIYKTKGTARGIKALLAAYGIPQTILTIREFGGPDNADLGIIPRAEWEKHTYYLNLRGSLPTPTTASYVSIPWEKVTSPTGTWQYPDTLTFRWKMEPESRYTYTGNSTQTLLQKQSGSRVDWFVTMDKNSGTDLGKGTLAFWIGDGTTYTSASFYDQYFYDDVPISLMIRRNLSNDLTASNQTYDVFVKTAKYGKLVIEQSASISINGTTSGSYNQAWVSDGNLYIGSGSNIQTDNILSGSIFELRYWSSPLEESSFNNHVIAPRAYNGNSSTSSFYDLQAQFKFWQEFDTTLTSSIASSHPNQTLSSFYSSPKTASLIGFNYDAFESITETYNMEVATVGNNTPFAEKVRLDSGSLLGGLDPNYSSEVSRFDKFSVDSNKLMVAFSPQSIINEDIYEAIGYTSIDDYFGEYSNIDKDEYPRLKWFAREYWQKYPNKNDFTAYIRLISQFDFSIFDQIRQTLPARVNEILGIVVEPNILERSKVRLVKNFSGVSETVTRTNEISSSGTPSATVSSKRATILIGFENESSYQEIDGETDIAIQFEGSQDINVAGDYDTVVIPTGFARQYKLEITSSRGTGFANFVRNTFVPYKTTITTTTGSINSLLTTYTSLIQNRTYGRVFGSISSGVGTGVSTIFGVVDTAFTNTFERENVFYSEGSPDIGFGSGWIVQRNDSGKSQAVFESTQSFRRDSYYSEYVFAYTSSKDMDERNYFSYTFTSASFENPHNLPKPIRDHRFDGCKLSGPDINVDSSESPDGKPVVEVFIVDPNQINLNQNFTNSGI